MTEYERCLTILRLLTKEYPMAGTRLEFKSLFELLVAVILSAQSTDEQVNRVTRNLFIKYSKPEDLAKASLAEIEDNIKAVGLYRNKARSLKEMAIMLMDKYNGKVPEYFEELLKLPGVGRKTANVVLTVGFGKPGLGVDTHVHRISRRLGLVKSKTPEQTEQQLKSLIPEDRWSQAHHLLISHGRAVCHARRPNCNSCILEQLCNKIIEPSKKD